MKIGLKLGAQVFITNLEVQCSNLIDEILVWNCDQEKQDATANNAMKRGDVKIEISTRNREKDDASGY